MTSVTSGGPGRLAAGIDMRGGRGADELGHSSRSDGPSARRLKQR